MSSRPESRIYPPSLRAIRQAQGMSGVALAAAAGISAHYLWSIETGRRTAVSKPIAAELARVLNVDLEAISRPVVLVSTDDRDGWPEQ